MDRSYCNGVDVMPKHLVSTPFGKAMREEHFLFADGYLNLNQVQDALRIAQDEAEGKPDVFIRYTYPARLKKIRATLGTILNAETDELVIVPNATTAINTVLRNLRFEHGDRILYLSTIYGAVEKTLQYLVESTPVQTVEVEYTLPISDEELVTRFRSALEAYGSSVRVAIFDTIVSMPGVRLPFGQLTEICRSYGVLSLIDAAHGIGHIPLDLGSLQPDFLVTNCHKWLHVPRAAAVFYVPFRNQHMMRSSLPTSHGFVPLETKKTIFNPVPVFDKQNAFVTQFEYTGTIDTAPALCIPAALKFREEICGGEERIRKYRHELAEMGEKKIAEILGTETLTIPPRARVNFANVWLPLTVREMGDVSSKDFIPVEDISVVSAFINHKLAQEYNVYVPVMFYKSAWLARFSADIYLDLDDFEHGARILKEVCERVQRLEYRDWQTRHLE